MSIEWQHYWCVIWAGISSDGAPAWVQAFGSIVALIVAIKVSKLSVKHAGEQRQRAIFSIAEAGYEYARQIRGAIELITEEVGSNANLWNVYNKDVTASLVRALQGVPAHELASGQQVLALLGLTNQLVFLGQASEKLMVAPSLLPEVSEMLKKMEDDRQGRRELLKSIPKILKSNALKHIDVIEGHYNVLKDALVK